MIGLKNNNDLKSGLFILFFFIYLIVFPTFLASMDITFKSKLVYYFGGLFIVLSAKKLLNTLKIYSRLNFLIILLSFSILHLFSLLNYNYSVVIKGSPEDPYILNSDPELYHDLGMILSGNNSAAKIEFTDSNDLTIGGQGINYIGYPIVLGALYRFYPDLSLGLLLNEFSAICIIILIGAIASLVFSNKFYVSCTLFLAAISPQILSSGTILLKDSLLILSITLLLFLSLKKGNRIFDLLFFALAILILITFRLPFILVLVPLVFIKFKIDFKTILGSFILLGGLLFLLENITNITGNNFSLEVILNKIQDGGTRGEWDVSGGPGIVTILVGKYHSFSLLWKILFLPLPVLVQYLLPFEFWNFSVDYPWRILERNFHVIWIFFIGPLVIFCLLNFKFIQAAQLKRIGLIGIIFFSLIALSQGGAIPRYYYPFISFLLPLGGYSIYLIKTEIRSRLRLNVYIFSLLILIVLSIFFYQYIKVF